MTGLAALNDMDAPAFEALLGSVFEHAPWVARAAWARRPFADIADLHAAMMAAVRAAPAETRRAFLNGHPELAGPEARARSLTADSASEQGSAGLDRMGEADAQAFDRLNAAYRARFGFRSSSPCGAGDGPRSGPSSRLGSAGIRRSRKRPRWRRSPRLPGCAWTA